jgi:hypothetical protein
VGRIRLLPDVPARLRIPLASEIEGRLTITFDYVGKIGLGGVLSSFSVEVGSPETGQPVRNPG